MAGLVAIQSELEKYYQHNLINCEIIDPEAGEQYCFLRAFISQGEESIIYLLAKTGYLQGQIGVARL